MNAMCCVTSTAHNKYLSVEVKLMKNLKMATRTAIITTLILVLGLTTVWIQANSSTNKAMKEAVFVKLKDAVATRYEVLLGFVVQGESYLVGYSQATELTDLFLDIENEEKAAKLQAYTEKYAKVNKNLENIYAASTESVVKASVVKGVIGVQLRTGEALKELQNEVFDDNTVWNTGIMASKSTGAMVVSMYYPVYDAEGEPIGYTGGAIYAEDLRNTLTELSNDGYSYMLLDVVNNAYIFHQDDTLIGKTIEDPQVLDIIDNAVQVVNGVNTYDSEDTRTLAVTKYDLQRGWVLVELTDYDTAFASATSTSTVIGFACIAALVVCITLVWLSTRGTSRDFAKLSAEIGRISVLDLTDTGVLQKFSNRKDEVGSVAKATIAFVGAVRSVIVSLVEQSKTLEETAIKMSETTDRIYASINGVENAVDEIATGAGKQAEETQQASTSVVDMGKMIEDISSTVIELNQVHTHLHETGRDAVETLGILTSINEEAKGAIEEISKQTQSTNDSAQKIRGAAELITSIAEETNLLSLNASIEAARAGEQGRGFAVVANQIQKLADQSNKSAKQIKDVIVTLLSECEKAVSIMDRVQSIMDEKSKRLQVTEQQFDILNNGIEKSTECVERIVREMKEIDISRGNVVEVVQSLAAIAEENAAGAEETLASTGLVTGMIADTSDVAAQLNLVSKEIEKSIDGFKL